MPVFAVFGDIHGNLDFMYAQACEWQRKNTKLDAILQVGDFQTVRTVDDLNYLFVPSKHKRTGDFPDYASGRKKAPILTIFTNGNHEAWNVLAEHMLGGCVAKNIHYLGRGGTTTVKEVTIGGLGELYNAEVFHRPIPRKPCNQWKYYRKAEIARLQDKNLDILLLHEWVKPVGQITITRSNQIPMDLYQGNQTAASQLVWRIKPKYVFMGHMHGTILEGTMAKTLVYGLPICVPGAHDFMKIIEL